MRSRADGAGSPHRALLYAERDEFLGCVGPFLRAGVAAGERVLAVVPLAKVAWLRAELGLAADAADFADARAVIANALVHGRPPWRVWAYGDPAGLICHVRDSGPGLASPLACYLGPGRGPHAGCGLQVASQLSGWMDVTGSADGTHVRLLAAGTGW